MVGAQAQALRFKEQRFETAVCRRLKIASPRASKLHRELNLERPRASRYFWRQFFVSCGCGAA
jgi:hypothetical protein